MLKKLLRRLETIRDDFFSGILCSSGTLLDSVVLFSSKESFEDSRTCLISNQTPDGNLLRLTSQIIISAYGVAWMTEMANSINIHIELIVELVMVKKM